MNEYKFIITVILFEILVAFLTSFDYETNNNYDTQRKMMYDMAMGKMVVSEKIVSSKEDTGNINKDYASDSRAGNAYTQSFNIWKLLYSPFKWALIWPEDNPLESTIHLVLLLLNLGLLTYTGVLGFQMIKNNKAS